MIVVKYNDRMWDNLKLPHKVTPGYYLKRLVEEHGGRVNTNGWHILIWWDLEFNEEQDAVAFKLKTGL
jgi:hypothetical protein